MTYKKIFYVALAFLALTASSAWAQNAYPVQNINLRAGPGSHYPVVEILARGEKLDILGCLDEMTWCEIETADGEFGWVSSYYLQASNRSSLSLYDLNQNGDIRIIIFKPNNYWDRHYKRKDFYKDRDHYIREYDDTKYPRRPREDRPSRPVTPPVKAESKPPKYQKQESTGRRAYNPLCPMGQNDC